jgi:hypothetical protein
VRPEWTGTFVTLILSIAISFLSVVTAMLFEIEARVDKLDQDARELRLDGRRLDRIEDRIFK